LSFSRLGKEVREVEETEVRLLLDGEEITTSKGQSSKEKVDKALADSIAKATKLDTFACIYSTISLAFSIVVLAIAILK
jgi:hypothetical protein